MKRMLALLVCLSGLNAAEGPPKLWWSSVAAEAAASSADAFTSLGKYELNPLLRAPNGAFSPPRATLYKTTLFTATVVPQYFLLRHHPHLARVFEIVNFGQAAVYGFTAFHNSLVRPRKGH